MRVLFDTNVILDVLLERHPFFEASQRVWKAVDEEQISGFVPASVLTDLYYIARKHSGKEKALDAVQVCVDTFEISAVDRPIIEAALTLPERDFEDAVQLACALTEHVEAIVTRDKDAYKSASISALSQTKSWSSYSKPADRASTYSKLCQGPRRCPPRPLCRPTA